MKNKYLIKELNICTFEYAGNGYIRPMLNEYPTTRLCVIDMKKLIAIDVIHELKYDYLETNSLLSFINGSASKIRENRRAAIKILDNIEIGDKRLKFAKDIIKKLENGYEFPDGNEILSNEKYLNLVENEQLKKYRKTNAAQFIKRKN